MKHIKNYFRVLDGSEKGRIYNDLNELINNETEVDRLILKNDVRSIEHVNEYELNNPQEIAQTKSFCLCIYTRDDLK